MNLEVSDLRERVGHTVGIFYEDPDKPQPAPWQFTGVVMGVTDYAEEGQYLILLQSEDELLDEDDGLRCIPLTWLKEVK